MKQASTGSAAALVFAMLLAIGACVGDDVSSTPTPEPSNEAGSNEAGGCGPDEKSCSRCVSKDDPLTGCAGPSCEPCQGTNAQLHLAAACVAGVCDAKCAAGFLECNKSPADGCEIPESATNCGACGTVCGTANTTGAPLCASGKCTYACAAGFTHCSTDPATGCETSTATDKKNCGACGHDCLEGTCTNGKCDAIELLTVLPDPYGLAVDATHVYVADAVAGLYRMKTDGTCTVACPEERHVGSYRRVVSNGTNVTFAELNGSIFQAPVASIQSGKVTLGTTSTTFGLALSGPHVLWTRRAAAGVSRWTTGGSEQPFANATAASSSEGIAADATTAYWTDSTTNKIYKQAVGDGPCSVTIPNCAVVTTAVTPFAIAVDATNVYFTETGASDTIKRVPKAGGPVTTIATGQDEAVSIAVTATHVYWGMVGSAPYIRRAPISAGTTCAGSACELVSSAGFFVESIAVDAKAVYWIFRTTGAGGPDTGKIFKLAQ